MMTRSSAFVVVVVPIAILMSADARLRAQSSQPPAQPPAAGATGVDVAALDKSANPCDDFYQFACGGWIKAHPAPADQPGYGRFNELQDRNNEILKGILEEAAKPGSPADMRKIGDYYSSCMDESAIEAKGTGPLAADLKRVDAIADKATIPAVVGYMHTVGMSGFFGFGAAPDFKDATQYMLIFAQGGLGLPDRDYYFKEDATSVKLREQYEAHVAKMLELAGNTAATAAAGAKTVMKIETALAKSALDRVAQRNPTNIYHKMSRDEVKKLMPSFNMSQYLERAEAPPGDSANVTEPEFLKAVDQIIASTPLPELKTYLRWHVVHSNAHMLPKRFVDENFNFYSKTLQGAQEQRPRWKRCVDAADSDLGEVLGKIYVERTFGAEGKERTLQMVHAIEASLATDIKEITWMSEETKKAAEVKLKSVANKIGYPDRWRDYTSLRVVRGDAYGNSQRANAFNHRRQLAKIGKPVDKTEWYMTPPTVNAYYNPLENNINFPAGILQPPFFYRSGDEAVNLGAAGAVVGHELSHGFDDQGRRFDASGRIRDWWTPETDRRFTERATRLGAQYGTYEPLPGLRINGELTMGENIGDLGGVEMAYAAYRRHVAQHGEPPVIDGLTGDQRFFLAWAQVWRGQHREGTLRERVLTDPHSPYEFRVNGVVRNVDAWYEAFNIQPGDPMYLPPEQRVRIW
jgi:putative endopeptidase